MTQETLAKRAGHGWVRTNVAKIESGDNQASSHGVRVRLAQGFGLSEKDMSDYIEGRLPLQNALVLTQADGRASREADSVAEGAGKAQSILESAIAQAFDPNRHFLRDIDSVCVAMRGAERLESIESKLVEAAAHWLDLAVAIRRRGAPVTTNALVIEMTLEILAQAERKNATDSSDSRRETPPSSPRPQRTKV